MATEQDALYKMLDSSLLRDCLFPSPSAKIMVIVVWCIVEKQHTLSMPDWSQLPEELLYIISTYLEENCFDVVHARSGCTSWRSSFPFPSSLLRTSYSLPSFAKFPRKSKGFCTSRRSLCSSLGEFVVLLNQRLLALTSAEMRWNFPNARCSELVTFRGRFYAAFLHWGVYVIDPCSLKATSLMPSQSLHSSNYLIPSGNDELFLVEVFFPRGLAFNRFKCRVSRLDEEAGKWVVVTDLGDRVLFIGHFGNVSCSAKELPIGCGVSGNSVLSTFRPGNVTYVYKYGVHTGNEEDDRYRWRCVSENLVTIFYTKP